MTDAIIAHLHAMEQAAIKRHEELLRRIEEVDVAAQCASLDASEAYRILRRIINGED